MSKLLEQELAASKQLKQLLAAEQQAVTARNIPAFEEVIEKKRLMLERIVQYEQKRIFLLESNGIKHGPESMDDYLKACNDDGKLTDMWQRLLSMAANCRDHNRQNHQLVELCSTHTRNALCVLRGEDMDQNVYGPDGDTDDPHENRPIAIA
jgi:flagellar biosynthesis/type III secretory pathway chaperone